MSKAEPEHTTNTTRRTVIAALVGSSLLVADAASAAPGLAPAGRPDPRLVALGAEYRRALQAAEEAADRVKEAREAVWADALTMDDGPNWFHAIIDAGHRHRVPELDEQYRRASLRLEALEQAIADFPSRSLADVAYKVRLNEDPEITFGHLEEAIRAEILRLASA